MAPNPNSQGTVPSNSRQSVPNCAARSGAAASGQDASQPPHQQTAFAFTDRENAMMRQMMTRLTNFLDDHESARRMHQLRDGPQQGNGGDGGGSSRDYQRRTPDVTPPDQSVNGGIQRLCKNEIGFFQPEFPDTHASGYPATQDSDIIYRDVYQFIDRLKDAVALHGEQKVKIQIPALLRGTAALWYSSGLEDTVKDALRYTLGMDTWYKTLEKQFRRPAFESQQQLLRMKFTLKDAADRRSISQYVFDIHRTARNAGINEPSGYLNFAYSNLDPILKQGMPPPRDSTTSSEFIRSLEEQRENWASIARIWLRRNQNQDRNRPSQQQYRGNCTSKFSDRPTGDSGRRDSNGRRLQHTQGPDSSRFINTPQSSDQNNRGRSEPSENLSSAFQSESGCRKGAFAPLRPSAQRNVESNYVDEAGIDEPGSNVEFEPYYPDDDQRLEGAPSECSEDDNNPGQGDSGEIYLVCHGSTAGFACAACGQSSATRDWLDKHSKLPPHTAPGL